ncbi:hypothetical protein A2852_01065 [Candidatus Adlerbacteria bacterium RIFCSPHIGHO2_01_FULL_54_23]|uniref:Cysteine desulfurase n=2 Tax=Candidatus Adleribacteriota TaxID=1752736 RepID=A0A0G1XXU6_9BACT|nr:MAG: Cysteine desulfurase [Candidatus Adlerbacteria bacterium GW2011_GWA1_54_10]KKW37348.1 MAG: Cysteine desulfurase [Candidatus Adlerbacteria bacterium GW2011_GWB1_54_7]OGC79430.1 MAG: hypothetical protein A2852_01065 [Candidatus Adlerbacteria bacterium RIFCSPHIGHO2_01_FULL_54_23]
MLHIAKSDDNGRLYLDYAAGAPLSTFVAAQMAQASTIHGNPSSLYEEGRAARAALEGARECVARALGARASEIIFTGSGSESDALALCGAARALSRVGRHIIVSSIEHKAVLKSARALEKEGFSVSYLPPDKEGYISPDTLARAVRADTVLVSVMYANNEIGTVEPVQKLVDAVRARAPRVLFHTDACQAPGQLPVDVNLLGVDLMSVNGSKAYGPKGIGALFVREGVRLEPIVHGEQEMGIRGGTESVLLAAGLAAALNESEALRKMEAPRLERLRDLLISQVESRISGARLHGPRENRLPSNVHFSFSGVEGEAMLLMLDARGISCATGSACNSLDLAPSHVLLAIGEDPELCHGSVRMTIGRATSEEDIFRATRELEDVVARLRSISALTIMKQNCFEK